MGNLDFSLYNFHYFQSLFKGLKNVHVQSGSKHQALIPKYLPCTCVTSSMSFTLRRLATLPPTPIPPALSRDHHPSAQSQVFSQKKEAWVKVESTHSGVSDSVTPGTVAPQAPLSMGFSRQEYWSGEPFPSPGDLPSPGMEPRSPTLQVDSLPTEPPGKTGEHGWVNMVASQPPEGYNLCSIHCHLPLPWLCPSPEPLPTAQATPGQQLILSRLC